MKANIQDKDLKLAKRKEDRASQHEKERLMHEGAGVRKEIESAQRR